MATVQSMLVVVIVVLVPVVVGNAEPH